MSHDKRRTYYTESKRQKFNATDHIREDWAYSDVAGFLENRAQGYSSTLRQILCTAAHLLKEAAPVMRGDYGATKAVAPVASKRNQQPGRLSGGEREALKKFAASVIDAQVHKVPGVNTGSEQLMEKAMAEGRAMLASVRKRALGVTEPGDGEVIGTFAGSGGGTL